MLNKVPLQITRLRQCMGTKKYKYHHFCIMLCPYICYRRFPQRVAHRNLYFLETSNRRKKVSGNRWRDSYKRFKAPTHEQFLFYEVFYDLIAFIYSCSALVDEYQAVSSLTASSLPCLARKLRYSCE